MPQINWKPDFSLGNIITMATMVIGLIIGWQSMVSDVKANTEDIKSLDQRLTMQEQRFNELLAANQAERVRQTEILTELRSDVKYLRENLSDLRGAAK